MYELEARELKLAAESEHTDGLKCATLGASPSGAAQLAAGGFGGRLQIFDLAAGGRGGPLFDAQAHAGIVNSVDGFGGRAAGYGPPEIASGGRDGAVRVWDVRQPGAPVAAFEPADAGGARCGRARGRACAHVQRLHACAVHGSCMHAHAHDCGGCLNAVCGHASRMRGMPTHACILQPQGLLVRRDRQLVR